MVILTKLLAINIVTRRVFGFWRISNTNCSLRSDEDSSSLRSLGCNEKYAVSLEDAIAEQSNSPHINNRHNITLADIPMKKGSAETAVSRHIRGSIDAVSKIKKVYDFECKDKKKKTKEKRPKTKVFQSFLIFRLWPFVFRL